MIVPTNAFQRTMLDGVTAPNLMQRMGSLIVPMLPLFQAGCIASFLGYGLTAMIILLRSTFMPAYVPVTQSVNVFYATLYTGAFLATVSNIRYQILQGIIEPFVDHSLGKNPMLRGSLIFVIRIGNGLLGSMLAISGMKLFELQRSINWWPVLQ